jgi:hypothetical protein
MAAATDTVAADQVVTTDMVIAVPAEAPKEVREVHRGRLRAAPGEEESIMATQVVV